MTRTRFFGSFLCLVVTLTSAAQHPNVARGFEADKIYQYNGLDNVNLYNGNLSLIVPLGPEYKGNGTLKYQFTLVYNSKAWDQEIETYICDSGQSNCDSTYGGLGYIKDIPSKRSNAGMGWLVSMGRLISPSDPMVYPGPLAGMDAQPYWTYESPDGADHHFLLSGPGVNGHTHDGSYLRLRELNAGTYEIDFPDGMVRQFVSFAGAASPRLVQIRDPFNNRLDVNCPPSADCTFREYAQTGELVRTHYVRMRELLGADEPHDAPANYDYVVDEVDLAGFGGRAIYEFEYTTDTIVYGCTGDSRWPYTPNPSIPRLRKLIRPDDARSSWQFDYYDGICSSMKKALFPTGGELEWTYQMWVMSSPGCRPYEVAFTDSLWAPYSVVEGVDTKTMHPGDGTSLVWDYGQVPGVPGPMEPCPRHDPYPGEGYTTIQVAKDQESKVTVTAPDDTKSTYYFSIAGVQTDPGRTFDRSEYGLPFTRNKGTDDDKKCDNKAFPSALCLSSQTFDNSNNLKSSTFVRYEGETRWVGWGVEQDRREVATRTVFHDSGQSGCDGNAVGAPCDFVETTRSLYDGLGHFRKTVVTDSWSGLNRTETVNYNPGKTAVTVDPVTWVNTPADNRPSTSGTWLLNLFDAATTSEKGLVFKKEVWFDSSAGVLKRMRELKKTNDQRDASDVIVTFDVDTRGNLTKESFYGGDNQAVAIGTLSTLALPSQPTYRLFHGYSYGTRNSTKYKDDTGADLLTVFDADIDQDSGLPATTRDAAGLPTTFSYDRLGRLTEVRPAGRAWTEYSYSPTASPPTASVEMRPVGSGSTAAPLIEEHYYYDGIGRLIQQKQAIPYNSEISNSYWAARNTAYDDAGRLWKSFEPVATAASSYEGSLNTPNYTTYTYDSLGRSEKVRKPDGGETAFAYTGSRERQIVSKVATPTNPAATSTTTERYDGRGRLVTVTQPAGPTSATAPSGANVVTQYGYDAADHLVTVQMIGAEGLVQHRQFDYDGRGFLRWESQPESGLASYSYDARGHVLTKRQGAANTRFDLGFSYDTAERLVQVFERNPFASYPGEPAFRILKFFEYGIANDNVGGILNYMKGQLVRTHRYNYSNTPPDQYNFTALANRDFEILTWDFFSDTAGRRTHRAIYIAPALDERYMYAPVVRSIHFGVEYDDLDHVRRYNYPLCADCGVPDSDDSVWRENMVYAYERGRLKSIAGVVDELTYWPNGMLNTLVHGNGIVDRQDVTNMPRPSSLSFGIYDRCVKPSITTQPASQYLAPGSSTTLSVSVAGTAPFQFLWRKREGENDIVDVGTTQSITIGPLSATTRYWVEISSPCLDYLSSDVAIVDVNSCPEPSIEDVLAVSQPDGAWVLAPKTLSASSAAQYQWRKLPSTTVIGTQRQLPVAAVTQTTTWSLTVVDGSCGSTTAEVTLSVPLQITPSMLQATAYPSPIRVVVTWPAASGATSSTTYSVERRSGPTWAAIGTATSTGSTVSFTDTTVTTGKTYAYRVKLGQNYSNSDVATTGSFSSPASAQAITAAHVDAMRDAVNSVRTAAGWPALAWADMLAASDAVPDPNERIVANHVISSRYRMNEALQALGVPLVVYARAHLIGEMIAASDFKEIQDRTK